MFLPLYASLDFTMLIHNFLSGTCRIFATWFRRPYAPRNRAHFFFSLATNSHTGRESVADGVAKCEITHCDDGAIFPAAICKSFNYDDRHVCMEQSHLCGHAVIIMIYLYFRVQTHFPR